MKEIKAFFTIAVILILSSCGNSSDFNYEKVDELHKYYRHSGLPGYQWIEFAEIYEQAMDYNIELLEKLAKKVKPGMSYEDVDRLGREDPEVAKFNDYVQIMEYMCYDGRSQMPQEASDRVDNAKKKLNDRAEEIKSEIETKMRQ